MTSRVLHPDYRAVILSEAAYGGLPVGYWPLDEVNGTTAVDVMTLARGSVNTGTIVGGVTLGAQGPISRTPSRAMTLDGSSGYISVGNDASLVPTSTTYEAWVYPTSLANAYTAIISKIDGGGDTFRQLFVKSNGKLACYLNTVGGITDYDGTGSLSVPTNAWSLLHLVYDASGGLSGYVNGVLDAHVAATGALAVFANAQPTCLGQDTINGGRLLSGRLANCAVYNYALDPTRILYHALAGINGIYSGAIAA